MKTQPPTSPRRPSRLERLRAEAAAAPEEPKKRSKPRRRKSAKLTPALAARLVKYGTLAGPGRKPAFPGEKHNRTTITVRKSDRDALAVLARSRNLCLSAMFARLVAEAVK